MILACPACGTRYAVPDGAIGAAGRQVRCASCGNSWFERPGGAEDAQATEPAAAPSVEPPAPLPASPQPTAEPVQYPVAETAPAPEEPLPDAEPVRRRRWPWVIGLLLLLLVGAAAALVYLGPPELVEKLGVSAKAEASPLMFEGTVADRRPMESGNELLAVSARIVNPTDAPQTVPDIRAELRDAQGRVVYGWSISPPVRRLAPKSGVDLNSAEVDVPKGSRALNLRFARAG